MKKKKKVLTQEEKEKNYKIALWKRERARKERARMVKMAGKEKIRNRVGSDKFNLVESCRGAAPEVFKHLEAIVKTPGRMTKMKIIAMREILDRGYGKSKETIETKGGPRIIEIVRPALPEKTARKGLVAPGLTAEMGTGPEIEKERAQ